MNSPKVSVLMPVYNGEHYLREAVESILTQTFADFEFIVINDGSTDKTAEILREYRDPRIVALKHENNRGIVAALNYGLEVASGEFVARHDADDVSLPDRLRSQAAFINDHPEVVVLGSAYAVINEEGQQMLIARPPVTDTGIRWQMLFHNAFCHGAVMVRRQLLRQRGLSYDPAARHAEDYDFWSKVLAFGAGRNLDEPLVKHRLHSARIGSVAAAEQQRAADAIAEKNIHSLGVFVAHPELKKLRAWFDEFPAQLGDEDLHACKLLLDILFAFRKKNGEDTATIRVLRRRWTSFIVSTVSLGQFGATRRLGLWQSLLREDTIEVLRALLRRARRRLKISPAPATPV
ncbi:MAG: glycosyltransferase family 2 protein [Candidatus Binatia bacterium]